MPNIYYEISQKLSLSDFHPNSSNGDTVKPVQPHKESTKSRGKYQYKFKVWEHFVLLL